MPSTSKRQGDRKSATVVPPGVGPLPHRNGGSAAKRNGSSSDSFARDLLAALLRFRDGDFSSRMPADLVGLEGKIADVFNDILAVSARRTAETARVCRVVGKEGKLKERMRVPAARGGWADEVIGAQHADRRPGVADDRGDARDRRRRQGRPRPDDGARRRRPPARGRVPALREARQHDGRAAVGVRVRGDARRARGRHRRQARRPGAGARASPACGRTSPTT